MVRQQNKNQMEKVKEDKLEKQMAKTLKLIKLQAKLDKK